MTSGSGADGIRIGHARGAPDGGCGPFGVQPVFPKQCGTRILGSNQDRDMKVTPAEVLGRHRAAF
jgi:hypothetical protein